MHSTFKLLKQCTEFVTILKSFLTYSQPSLKPTSKYLLISVGFKDLNITISVKLWLVFMICTTKK